jgi:hypothetical protein
LTSLRTALVVLAVMLGALGLAACGSDDETSDQDYVSAAEDVAASFTESAQKLEKQIDEFRRNLNLKSAGNLLSSFADSVEGLADEIDDISPPSAVEGLHTQLVDLLNNFASKAEQAALALKAGDLIGGFPALANFATDASQVGSKVDSTVSQIQSKLGVD